MGVLLRRRWGKTGACFMVHGPWQQAVVRCSPSSLPVMVGDRAAAHVPGSLQRVRLRREKFSTGGYLGVRTSAVSSLSSAPRVFSLDTTQVRSIEDRYSPPSS